MRLSALTALSFALVIAAPLRALACGASGGGATGVYSCSLSEHEEAMRKKWRVGGAYSFTNTVLTFDGTLRVEQTRQLALASVAYRPTRAWTLELNLGSLVAGDLDASERAEFKPGVAAAVSGAWRALEAKKARPFILLTGQISYVDAPTEFDTGSTPRYRALDFRLGGLLGWSIAHVVAPYVVTRAFGGPIFWQYQGQSVLGTDRYHYQVGAGLSVLIAQRVDLYFEGVPFGEQVLSGGAGVAF